jgi:ABC-type transporter Mla subunit MlaD
MAPEQRFQQIEETLSKNATMQQETQGQLRETQVLLRALVESQSRTQATISGLVESIGGYVDAADARMKRIEENLDGLIRAITAEHTNGKNRH